MQMWSRGDIYLALLTLSPTYSMPTGSLSAKTRCPVAGCLAEYGAAKPHPCGDPERTPAAVAALKTHNRPTVHQRGGQTEHHNFDETGGNGGKSGNFTVFRLMSAIADAATSLDCNMP